jgi:hypothetical protein
MLRLREKKKVVLKQMEQINEWKDKGRRATLRFSLAEEMCVFKRAD